MFNAIVNTVEEARNLADIELVVPSGTAIQNGRTSYIGDRFTRDGFHLDLGIGRFTAASTWFEALFGGILENPFYPENLLMYDTELAKQAAYDAVNQPKVVTDLVAYKERGPNEFTLEHPLFIDFGPKLSPDPYNNFIKWQDGSISGLKDEQGNNSAYILKAGMQFHEGVIDRAMPNLLGLPLTASQDAFFNDGLYFPDGSLNVSPSYFAETAMLTRAMLTSLLLPIFLNAETYPFLTGTQNSMMISLGSNVFVFGQEPSTSSIERTLRPEIEKTITEAPRAASAQGVSAAGEALAKLPPTVALFLIWTEPIDEAASESAVALSITAMLEWIEVIVSIAPNLREESMISIPLSSGIFDISNTAASSDIFPRVFISQSVPPATKCFFRSPHSTSNAENSFTLLGANNAVTGDTFQCA